MLALFSTIASLFFIEVLLSIDNALVNATIAHTLGEDKRKKALRIGIILGAFFRLIALLFAGILIHNTWVKIIGALYLIYLALSHLGKVIDTGGHVIKQKDTYRGVIIQIAIADIVFSLDNVISAVSFSKNIAMVMLGVGIGIISMLFITPILSKIIQKYKGMAQAAYAIVGYVGICLLVETIYHIEIGEAQKFFTIGAILLYTVCYEHFLPLRRYSLPLLKSAQYIIAIPLDIGKLIFSFIKKYEKNI